MGLDMYLDGEIYFCGLSQDELKTRPVAQIFRLGYWRKHADLHGYIVENFACGEDNREKIYLDADNLAEIVEAIRNDELPHTEGFFFGASSNDEQEKAEAMAIFSQAIAWLAEKEDNTFRQVTYQASW